MEKKPLVALALVDSAERRLVVDCLSTVGCDVAELISQDFPPADLFILDVPSARRYGPHVLERKKQAGIFLPVLVMLRNHEPVEPWLAAGFDQVLRLSLSRAELQATMAMCLRLRRQAQELARMGDERHEAIFEATGTATIIVDEDATIVMANQECLRVTGYRPEELIGTKWTSYVHPDSLEMMLRYHKARREEPEKAPKQYQARLVDKAGRVRTAYLTVGLLPDSGQSIVSMVDITEQKEAEEALRESETRNRLIADLISDYAYIFRVTPEGELEGEWVTDSFVKVFGFSREEIDARGGWQSLVYPADLQVALRHAQKVASGQTDVCEMRWVTSEGEVRWLRDYARPVFDAAGKRVVRIYGASQDITERKRAEAERDCLLQAIEQSGEIILVTDAEGAIQYVNRAFEKITGYTREEVIGKHPRMLESGEHDEAFFRELRNTITSGRTWRGRMVKKRKDGSLYTEEATISPVRDGSGRITNFVAVERDITEQLRAAEAQFRLEEQLRQAQKMEAIGRFAGGVAHDLNNILTIIMGYGAVILQELPLDDPLRAEVEEIVAAGQRASELTNQLLAFGRKQTLRPQALDLNEVVVGLEKMLRRLIGEDIEVVLALSEDLPSVKADRSQVEQVLMNLAANARDAMPGGGKLLVGTSLVEFGEDCVPGSAVLEPGQYVCLAVSDTGQGMDKEVLSKIFEPFFTTKERGLGTGLGLAMVYGAIKQMGGDVAVYSEPGQGSTFRIYLPTTTDQSVNAVGPVPKEAPSGAGEHILVVEDEAALRRLLEQTLSRLGYQVTVAADGREALRLVEQECLRADLLLTDVVMPGMSGVVLAEQLRERCPNIKVLLMSGYADDALAGRGVSDKKTSLIQKPFSASDIAVMVRKALDND